jgi:tRNA threonylcarbamoyladenosine biosynthesis protein TsaE
MEHFTAKNAEATLNLGIKLGQSLKPGDVIALYGGLGAGKTVFAKGIAKGLDITDEVTSPTFTLLRQYQGRLALCHFDLYRIEDDQELEHIGFFDYLGGDNVCVIEWPENAPDLHANIRVSILGSGSEERRIDIINEEDSDEYTCG